MVEITQPRSRPWMPQDSAPTQRNATSSHTPGHRAAPCACPGWRSRARWAANGLEPPGALPITGRNICVSGTEQLYALFTQTGYFACSSLEGHTLSCCVSPRNISSPVFYPTQRLSAEKKRKKKKSTKGQNLVTVPAIHLSSIITLQRATFGPQFTGG